MSDPDVTRPEVTGPEPPKAVTLHPGVVYTLGRLILFAACAVVLWALGLDAFMILFGGLALSIPLSWFILRGPREEWAQRIDDGVQRRKSRRAEMDAQLDEEWESDPGSGRSA